jgi:hypothetical protein
VPSNPAHQLQQLAAEKDDRKPRLMGAGERVDSIYIVARQEPVEQPLLAPCWIVSAGPSDDDVGARAFKQCVVTTKIY